MSVRSIALALGCWPLISGAAAPTNDPNPAPTPPAAAADMPILKPGLWEYRRTLQSAGSTKPQVTTIRKCTDPGADMRDKRQALEKKGCQFDAPTYNTHRASSSWTCTTPSGIVRFVDVLAIKDPTSYQDVSEIRTAQHANHQKIEATRLGECPAMGSGVQPTPGRKPLPHG